MSRTQPNDQPGEPDSLRSARHQVADVGAPRVALAGDHQYVTRLALIHGHVNRKVVAVFGVDGVGGAKHDLALVERHQVGVHGAVAGDAQLGHAIAQLGGTELAESVEQVLGDQFRQGQIVFGIHGVVLSDG